ncbi:16241_t:CDS:2 [Entrophospora sp. SA101]|nr:16989_t:CDS:2 [Entrophospora sp. SA101]CAJ0911596.1 16241_t:CDS:2 [Entrophospora sp. SA101]
MVILPKNHPYWDKVKKNLYNKELKVSSKLSLNDTLYTVYSDIFKFVDEILNRISVTHHINKKQKLIIDSSSSSSNNSNSSSNNYINNRPK